MRIAIDLRSLMETGGRISGVENYLLYILRRLPVEGTYCGFYNSFRRVSLPQLPEKLNVQASSVPNKVLNSTMVFFGWPKFEALYGRFETLWMPDLRPFAIRAKTKLAVTVHDLSPVMHPELYSWKRRFWHRIINYRKSFRRADLIFAVSEYTKYDLMKIFGVPEKKIKVVYSGIDHDKFRSNLDRPALEEVRSRYRLPEKFILTVSTIEPRKNLGAVIQAFENLNDPKTELLIAGRLGWLYSGLLGQIARSPKKSKIRLLGYVPETDKPYLIANACVVCYPSYYEGFGFVPLEAMACGVPVITSARTSMAEICADAALLVEPYALTDLTVAMRSLMNDPGLRQKFVTRGLQRAAQFSWQKCASEVHAALQQISG